ncbi:hypothetical protein MSG28_003049 [Choristoneura fumiferana]|uniref:Uncharacterized protein n=1 Tax=Choristoneura fumiferana TaxID=7141 RepID=A0ACC0JKA9_CHOFU|nr:hypothetical protein MSG28_003049 [Choristoneura fumiferana]
MHSVLCFLSGNFKKNDWYVDSGASAHLTANESWIKNGSYEPAIREIVVANKESVPVLCSGDVQIATIGSDSEYDIVVQNVLCVPNITTNLLSVSQLINKGNKVEFNDESCKIFNKKGDLVATASLMNGVYKLNMPENTTVAMAASADTWHRRLGHVNSAYMNKMQNAVEGFNLQGKVDHISKASCKVCCEGKQCRLPFPNEGNRSDTLLNIVHTDICGPMEVESIGGSRYYLLFVDDFSRMAFIFFIKNKSEALKCFKEFKAKVENQLGKKIKILRSDNGREFCNNQFDDYLKESGIIHQRSNNYSPEQNGLCERLNRSVVEKARCLLYDGGLSLEFWAEAANTAVYLRNRTVAAGLNGKTPYEVWTNTKPDLSHLRIFGSTVMEKTDSNGNQKEELEISRDSVGDDYEDQSSTLVDSSGDQFTEFETADTSENTSTPIKIRPQRERRPPERYGITNICIADKIDDASGLSLQEALQGPEKAHWKQAMTDELKSFEENDAWELVSVPDKASIVKCKWVLKKKYDSENHVRYRARLVAKGFTQKLGVDYEETFSPVVRYTTLRLLFALAVRLGFDISHLDVTTAFLNGFLEETIYMQIPEGFVGGNTDGKVLKLKRAIYGLKQSSRAWYRRVDDCLVQSGYIKSKLEPCLYVNSSNGLKTIIALYVDDFFLFSNDEQETKRIKQELSSQFKLKDLGQVKQCLGMNVNIDKQNNVITLDQESYIDQLLHRFNMTESKVAETPMEEKLNLEKASDCKSEFPYQQLIGSLMYLAVLTRPDIMYALSYMSQFNNSYNEQHWCYAKRILRYLKKTKHYCLKYSKDGKAEIEGFVDADWAHNVGDRRSYTGFNFMLSGGAISWESKKQKTVALSSTEAEYMGISEACKEAIYLRNLQFEITGHMYAVVLYNDNQSAQKLLANPVFHKRSKHIDVRYHFCRESVADNLEAKPSPVNIKKKLRRKRRKLLLVELMQDFAHNTTLHGPKYIAEKGLSTLERLFWITTFLISIGMCAFLIRNVWVKWETSPVLVSLSEHLVPVGEPFVFGATRLSGCCNTRTPHAHACARVAAAAESRCSEDEGYGLARNMSS